MPRSLSLLFVVIVSLLTFPIWAQNAPPPWIPIDPMQPNPVTTPAPQDHQAVDILNQALAVAGGSQAIKAITDYTFRGQITYHGTPELLGDATIIALGADDIRVDASLPTGLRSWAIHDGRTAIKSEDGKISQTGPVSAAVPSSDAFPYQTPLFPGNLVLPYGQLLSVLNNPIFGITYKGVVQIETHSVHQIEIQRVRPGILPSKDPGIEFHTRQLFIDNSSFQIVMIEDVVPKHTIHRLHYSDYRSVNGLYIPFLINDEIGEQAIWTFQVGQMAFNSGLQDSAFTL